MYKYGDDLPSSKWARRQNVKSDLEPIQVKVKGQGHQNVKSQMRIDVSSMCVQFQASAFDGFSGTVNKLLWKLMW